MARKMKDSGIPWVGKIPEDWEVTRLKYVMIANDGGVWGDEPTGSNDTIVIRSTEQEIDGRLTVIDPAKRHLSQGDVNRARLKCGDLIITKSSGSEDHIGKASLITQDVANLECCCSNFLQRIRVRDNPKFIWYVLNSAATKEHFKRVFVTSTGLKNLNGKKIAEVIFTRPPLAEQKRITEYLDKTVGRIDGLREKISREIERLGDYKKSMISEAVCRGLDKTAKMKDSGIPWVGKIPAGWEVKKIASLYNVRNQKVSEKDFPALSVSKLGVVPQLSHVAKSNDTDNRKLVRAGDFAINSRSDRRGACGIAKQDGSVSLINIVLKPLENMEPGYFDWLFHSSLFADEFYKWGKGIDADVWSTHWTMMKKIRVPYPPLAEQKRIAEYIDKQVAKIDALIEKRKAEFERLEALKRSIICECVTGKMEVA